MIGAETDDALLRYGVEPQPWDAGRGRHRDDQLHERHDRPPEGRAAHPPQPLDQRDDVRLAARRQRPRRVPAHAAAVPLQRLGHALRRRPGMGAHARHHPQDRRRRDPAPRRAARRDADVRRAGRRQRGPRRGGRRGTATIPGAGRVRIVVAGAPPPTRTIERIETELGWEFIQIYGLTETSPFLTMNRSRAEFDDLSPADRAREAQPRRRARRSASRCARRPSRARCSPAATSIMDGYWNQPEATADAIRATSTGGWFHTGDGGSIDDDHYVTISDRKKDVIISRRRERQRRSRSRTPCSATPTSPRSR